MAHLPVSPKHSTETALLRVFNDLLTASDSGSISILTLVDLSAVFDIIDHGILLTRLKITFSIFYLALSFFDSYLQGRTEAVTPNEVKSSPSLPTCGVPQRSVLGPVLFILYTQPRSDVISHHSVSQHMFADDTELHKSDSPSEAFTRTLAQTIESCISDVKVWVVENKLQLNDDKTEIPLIGSAPGIDLPSSLCVDQ